MITERLADVQSRVLAAATHAGRDPKTIELIAVSKTMPESAIQSAIAAGQVGFGENYVQEAGRKSPAESKAELRLHLIGHLQSNKSKEAVGFFDVIQTVHKVELAKKLNTAAEQLGIVQDVMLQVNISKEDSKSGVEKTGAEALARSVLELPHLRLLGLMIIGSYVDTSAPRSERVAEFVELRNLRASIERNLGVSLPHLSMGMSHDFELAIEEGATMVRVGSAIFGGRN